MQLPDISEPGFSSVVYLILAYMILMGSYQWYLRYSKGISQKRSLVPLGTVALIFGIIGYLQGMRESFEAIAEAGDISPSLVAAGISYSFSHIILGLLVFALSFLFKYVNPPAKRRTASEEIQ